jgi:hypothetical protein
MCPKIRKGASPGPKKTCSFDSRINEKQYLSPANEKHYEKI